MSPALNQFFSEFGLFAAICAVIVIAILATSTPRKHPRKPDPLPLVKTPRFLAIAAVLGWIVSTGVFIYLALHPAS